MDESYPDNNEPAGLHSAEYHALADLEGLETLLEDVEEAGVTDSIDGNAPAGIRERMEGAGVRDVQQLRAKIMHLHAALDDDADELTISES